MNKKMRMVWPGENFLIVLLLLVVTGPERVRQRPWGKGQGTFRGGTDYWCV